MQCSHQSKAETCLHYIHLSLTSPPPPPCNLQGSLLEKFDTRNENRSETVLGNVIKRLEQMYHTVVRHLVTSCLSPPPPSSPP